MSVVFARDITGRQKLPPGHSTVQKLLDENAALIQAIAEFQNMGRVHEAAEYQQTLHRNLVYLANLADDAQSLLAELQAPPDQNVATTNAQQPVPTVLSSARTESQPQTADKSANVVPYYASESQQHPSNSQYQPQPPPTSSHQLGGAVGSMGPPHVAQQTPPGSAPYAHQQPQQVGPATVPQGYLSSAAQQHAYQPQSAVPQSNASSQPYAAAAAAAAAQQPTSSQPQQAQLYVQTAPPPPPPHAGHLYSQAAAPTGNQPNLYAQAGGGQQPSFQQPGLPYSQAGPQTGLYSQTSGAQQGQGPPQPPPQPQPPHSYAQAGGQMAVPQAATLYAPQAGLQSTPQQAYQQQQQYYHAQYQQQPMTYPGGGPQAPLQYPQQQQRSQAPQGQAVEGAAYYGAQAQQRYQQTGQTAVPVVQQPGGHGQVMYQQAVYQQSQPQTPLSSYNGPQPAQAALSRSAGAQFPGQQTTGIQQAQPAGETQAQQSYSMTYQGQQQVFQQQQQEAYQQQQQ